MANKFLKDFVDSKSQVEKIPDLYPSLYEEDRHESYGDQEGRYVLIIDMNHGYVEFFIRLGEDEPKELDDKQLGEPVKIKDDRQEFKDKYEQMVYESHYNRKEYKYRDDSFTAISLKVFGTFEDERILKIYSVVRRSEVVYYNDGRVIGDSGYLMPTVSLYEKSGQSYQLKEVIEPKDGDQYAESIRDMCKERPELADELLDQDNDRLNQDIRINIENILRKNGYKNIDMDGFH